MALSSSCSADLQLFDTLLVLALMSVVEVADNGFGGAPRMVCSIFLMVY